MKTAAGKKSNIQFFGAVLKTVQGFDATYCFRTYVYGFQSI